ncbi:DUF6961 family protein [Sphingomonas sp. LY54]|uniref:DUF6961 family protein n=1 Tax=Sphingomonas sp. LY54 TaxID=3095343 RepID=UPI003A7F2DBE
MVQYGDRAPFVAAVRIAELSNWGDQEGVATWRHIASRIEALAGGAVGSAHQVELPDDTGFVIAIRGYRPPVFP